MNTPMTPAGCDVSGLEFMPLDGRRLIASDLFTLSNGEEFKAAIALWVAAWNEMPAGSLPNDERILARAAGYGRDLAGFAEVREMAMRGFVLCDDGRWYHPVVCEKVLTAWEKCEKQRSKANKRWATKPKTACRGISRSKSPGNADGYATIREGEVEEKTPYNPPKTGDGVPSSFVERVRPSRRRKAANQFSASFLDAWAMWPKNVRASAKQISFKLWDEAELDHGSEAMLAAVRAFLRSPDATRKDDQGRERGYVSAMEVWLRKKLDFWIEHVQTKASESSQAAHSEALPSSPQWWAEAALAAKNYDPKFWTGYASRCMPDREAEAPTLIAPSDLVRERVELRFRMIGLEQIKIRTQAPEAAR